MRAHPPPQSIPKTYVQTSVPPDCRPIAPVGSDVMIDVIDSGMMIQENSHAVSHARF